MIQIEPLVEQDAAVATPLDVSDTVVVQRADLQQLLDALKRRGYELLGPTIRDGAIIYDEVARVEDLPSGWSDVQEAGKYRLVRRDDAALFAYAVGSFTWKRWLFPPVQTLWQAHRVDGELKVVAQPTAAPLRALIGVRACEIAAIAVQDRVFLDGHYPDPYYKANRDSLFIVAVNCGHPSATCFCVSMETGPQAKAGYDLALTEVLETGRHYFVVAIGSPAGAAVMVEVTSHDAATAEVLAAQEVVDVAAGQMGRTLDTGGLKELLYRNYENPRWDDVASRCLSCANCTMVCPTCFCSTVEDTNSLSGDDTERSRSWDSCFTMDFSYIHGGSVRPSGKARYRQWMTHKLATWVDQFGSFGCVGCGRCIAWCPVGIDITAEARAIRASEEHAR